jgi:hypothetical protein
MPWSPLKGRTRAVLANSCSWDGAPLTASRQRHHPILECYLRCIRPLKAALPSEARC